MTATPGQFKSLPRDFDNKYQLTYGLLETSPHLPKRCPPSPPRRQSSRDATSSSIVAVSGSAIGGDIVIDCSGPVPTASCDDHRIHHHQHHHLLHHVAPPPPPPPAPAPPASSSATPHLNRPPSSMSRSWGSVSVNVNEEHELIASLALQHRNGSDASFKVHMRARNYLPCTSLVTSFRISFKISSSLTIYLVIIPMYIVGLLIDRRGNNRTAYSEI